MSEHVRSVLKYRSALFVADGAVNAVERGDRERATLVTNDNVARLVTNPIVNPDLEGHRLPTANHRDIKLIFLTVPDGQLLSSEVQLARFQVAPVAPMAKRA